MSQRRIAIIIDMQNDFLPSGPIPVNNISDIIPNITSNLSNFDTYLFVRDWHTPNNISFSRSHQNKIPGDEVSLCGFTLKLWEQHCIAETKGAQIIPELESFSRSDKAINAYTCFRKGSSWNDCGTSALGTLYNTLSNRKWRETITFMGVGTDHSIRHTVIEAMTYFGRSFDFEVKLDCVASFDKEAGEISLHEMERAGAKLIL